ncbi:MAG: DNA-directed RNA polymerase subunit omega [Bacillota bacterium]|nr:DNA-directed RNA polymerase subunit omega [Bacillota bacterium]MDW7682592.1 DNA-directed RNA polymerase subunit omega [Bacillota bacterium]
MIYPSIDTLMTKVDSKYTLVIAAAKRARMLNENSPRLVETDSLKDVSIALEEIATGKIGYERLPR